MNETGNCKAHRWLLLYRHAWQRGNRESDNEAAKHGSDHACILRARDVHEQRGEAWKNAKVTPRNDHAPYRLDESCYSSKPRAISESACSKAEAIRSISALLTPY
ncbi:MAG TPA: hypothetical protein VH138_15390, partial [Vicinamibacterales bacterium]|nr:hypothetical protein [Vicinamibacterales bacterium]